MSLDSFNCSNNEGVLLGNGFGTFSRLPLTFYASNARMKTYENLIPS